jgi:DNA invertase Pin-like site-specific DNA recombinase
MLTVLGGFAEFERDLIRTRTSEGRARAVANGVKLGRKPTLTPHQQREAIKVVRGEKRLVRSGGLTTSPGGRLRDCRRSESGGSASSTVRPSQVSPPWSRPVYLNIKPTQSLPVRASRRHF